MAGRVIVVAQQKGGAGKTTLAANLAVDMAARGLTTAIVDSDPQGSLGRWFMARRTTRDAQEGDIAFSTSSAWGVAYEAEKLRAAHDIVIVDTPPKIDADLRPALREADLVLVPVSASAIDLWATGGVLDLAAREERAALLVLNRARAGTRLADRMRAALSELNAPVARTVIGNRVALAEVMEHGLAVAEAGAKAATARSEIHELGDEILELLTP